MHLATVLTPESDHHLRLAAQSGVSQMVTRYPGPGAAALAERKRRFADFDLELTVIEGYLPIENLKLGKDDGSELAAMTELIQAMGDLEIPLLCYNFMAGSDWVRTRLDFPERAGAQVTSFDLANANAALDLARRDGQPLRAADPRFVVSEQLLWQSLARMLNELLPVAEKAGVALCMHPDDPPLSEFGGRARILNSVASFQRLVTMAPSPSNALCFCQGTFATMGVDIPSAICQLGDHIRYVHFRDVRGTPDAFVETFHDNGPTDMAAAMRAYRNVGFSGPIRADHVPQLDGEEAGEPGYTTLGRLFAWGYIRGLIDATAAFPEAAAADSEAAESVEDTIE